MALAPGNRLGPYEIVSAIGAGGMGEVYRARDSKLNRDVAIKVLPELFASDPERLARFEREAQVLASLNHPHIAHVYGVETSASGAPALVMELVDGEDLAQRLGRGALAIDEAVAIAKQIVDGLETAHERGVIHRDLKPSNIKVRDDGTVKILDFGLAKAFDTGAWSQTSTSPETMAGTIMGTAAFMAPEQAKGKPIDKRADIWASGVVLYEMLTGRHPFPGESTTEVLGAVVLKDVDWSQLPAATPPRVRELLRRCLEKDPRQRLRDIGDARFDLQAGDVSVPAARSRPPVAALIALGVGVALLAAAATWLVMRAPASTTAPAKRLSITGLPLVYDAYQSLALSPDGNALAFRGRGPDGIDRVFIRSLDREETRPMAGTEGARLPFFSPDGQWLGFFTASQLKKIPVSGGSALVIAPARNATGATWMDDGSIVFVGDAATGVQRVASGGGTPETVLPIGPTVNTPASPWGLPGSRHILLMLRNGPRFDVAVVSLTDRTIAVLAEDAYSPVWAESGHILFHQNHTVMALPVDRTFRAAGSAFPVLQGLGTRISYQSRLYAAAGDGTVVFAPAEPPGEAGWALVSVDRKGQETRLAGLERQADSPRLSPDGSRVAFRTPAPNCDVWVHDLRRGTTTRVTREGDNHGIVWSADGSRIFVARTQGSGAEIISLAADGSGDIQKIATFAADSGAVPTSMAAGTLLVQIRFNTDSGMDVVAVPIAGGKAVPLIAGPFDEASAMLSPDGALVAYVSNESGRNEVYVRPTNAQGGRLSISTAGGTEPAWSPTGKDLFYRRGHEMVSVTFDQGRPSRPQVLFSRENALGALGSLVTNYDSARDGRTFLTVTGRQWKADELAVVVNWLSGWTQSGSGARPGAH